QGPDPRLEQALLVLRGVVLEVLRQVAVLSRRLDRLDDRAPPWPLELSELGLERRPLRRGQVVGRRIAHRRDHKAVAPIRPRATHSDWTRFMHAPGMRPPIPVLRIEAGKSDTDT